MILYPTETIYALGVNALDEAAVVRLYELKGRGSEKGASWLVRDIEDIARYGELTPLATAIAERFLPGPLTLVLRARDTVPRPLRGPNDTVSFRISPDPQAQVLIAEFMSEYDAPLTCTSANRSGEPTLRTPSDILKQFGERVTMIERIVDDGERSGTPSTVVRVIEDTVEVLREGAVPGKEILAVSMTHE